MYVYVVRKLSKYWQASEEIWFWTSKRYLDGDNFCRPKCGEKVLKVIKQFLNQLVIKRFECFVCGYIGAPSPEWHRGPDGADVQSVRCVMPFGGWDASLAQMIGLWARRRSSSRWIRAFWCTVLYPMYRILAWSDNYQDWDFQAGIMFTGLVGTAQKPPRRNVGGNTSE